MAAMATESVLAVSAIKRKPSVNPAMMIPMRTILVFCVRALKKRIAFYALTAVCSFT